MEINIEQHVQKARELFTQGYNCAQCVSMAYADHVKMTPELLGQLSIAFGGGFGRQRHVCGTLSGAGIIIGLLNTPQANDNATSRKMAYTNVQRLSEDFKAENGSIICRELLALKPGEQCNPTPSERTEQYYQRRPCVEYVACSARLLGKMIEQL